MLKWFEFNVKLFLFLFKSFDSVCSSADFIIKFLPTAQAIIFVLEIPEAASSSISIVIRFAFKQTVIACFVGFQFFVGTVVFWVMVLFEIWSRILDCHFLAWFEFVIKFVPIFWAKWQIIVILCIQDWTLYIKLSLSAGYLLPREDLGLLEFFFFRVVFPTDNRALEERVSELRSLFLDVVFILVQTI